MFKGRLHGAGPTHQLSDRGSVLIVKTELFVERITTALGADIISSAQGNRAAQRADLAFPPGMKLFVGPALGFRQQLG